MKKHYSLIALIAIIVFTAIAIVNYSAYPYQFWTKLTTNNNESNIIEPDKSSWKVTPVQISKNIFEGSYFFYDQNTIFGVSFGKPSSIYRTLDGGKKWEKRSSITDFDINDIVFISPTEGFLLVSKPESSSAVISNKSSVIKTEDGGLSWKTVYTSADANLYNLKFNSSESGVLTGRRKSPPPSSDSADIVLTTNDKGKNWTEVSEKLYGRKEMERGSDRITNAVASEDKGIVLLTNTGKLFNTVNNGKSWNLIALLADKEPQIGFNRFGELENGKFWIAGGTTSIEGKWSEVAVTNGSGWDRNKLKNYYFSDVSFLSNNEVIACGWVFALDASSAETKELTVGIIMYSPNAGKDWETVYTSESGWEKSDPRKSAGGFYSISKISKDKMFVRGENGIDLMLERVSKTAGD